MVLVDVSILEFLREYGNHQPSAIRDRLSELGSDMDYSGGYINQRCRKLRDYDLVRNVGGGVYSITDLGDQFLAGDLDAGVLDPDDED